MYREYGRWWSPSLGREMEFLWFGKFGRPVMLFPTSSSRFYECEDFGLVGSLAGKVDSGEIQLVCVDSVDAESWYNRHAAPAVRAARHAQYDAYLRNEMAPYVFNRAQRGDLAVYGASFGAYHAANFAARYPDVVSRAICFSGIYDIHQFLGGWWDDTCYFHCPTAFIPNLDGEWVGKLSRIGWVIATGEYDTLVQKNRDFAGLLSWKGIPNHLEIWRGVFGHDWPWWLENLPRFV
ncbi:MAG TPA: alpha/beta hydrolase-fold protein [Thermoanaerobaculia bacterium]|nr:alpha/beta hydrolase-fold protein [Thermoanaerobaculia bacterium]